MPKTITLIPTTKAMSLTIMITITDNNFSELKSRTTLHSSSWYPAAGQVRYCNKKTTCRDMRLMNVVVGLTDLHSNIKRATEKKRGKEKKVALECFEYVLRHSKIFKSKVQISR